MSVRIVLLLYPTLRSYSLNLELVARGKNLTNRKKIECEDFIRKLDLNQNNDTDNEMNIFYMTILICLTESSAL